MQKKVNVIFKSSIWACFENKYKNIKYSIFLFDVL